MIDPLIYDTSGGWFLKLVLTPDEVWLKDIRKHDQNILLQFSHD